MKPLGRRITTRMIDDDVLKHSRALEKRRAAKNADPENDVYEAEYRKCSAYPDCEVCGPALVEEDDD